LQDLIESVKEPSNPIGMRMRAAYYLRSQFATASLEDNDSQDQIILALAHGLKDGRQGSLMRHEFAYVMGQLRDDRCCPALEDALLLSDDCVMVRHEAAEALGAIGANRSYAPLRQVVQNIDTPMELVETCQIALDVMEWRDKGGDAGEMPAACACMLNPYSSVDPAPPHPSHANKKMPELGQILGNKSLPLFERYRAMFSLRNIGGAGAVKELCTVLVEDDSSALLRHEVAYVLGQMQHPESVEALEQSLLREHEHKMVRHESAEALGAIDGRWEDVEPILKKFAEDGNDVVRESCMVALDAAHYWQRNKAEGDDGAEDENLNAQTVEPCFAKQKADNANSVLQNHFNIACSTLLSRQAFNQ